MTKIDKPNKETIEALEQVQNKENLPGPYDSFDDYLEYAKTTNVLKVSNQLIEKNREAYKEISESSDTPTWKYQPHYSDEQFRELKKRANYGTVVKKYRRQYPDATPADCARITGIDLRDVIWYWPKTYDFFLSDDVDTLSKNDSSFMDNLGDIQKRFMKKDYGNISDDQVYDNLTAFYDSEGEIFARYPSQWGDICIIGLVFVDDEPIIDAQIMFLSEYNESKDRIQQMEEEILG